MAPSKLTVLILTAVAGAALTAFAVAGPMPQVAGGVLGFFGHHHRHLPGAGRERLQDALDQLGLSDTQRVQVKGVIEQHRSELKAGKQQVMEAREALWQAGLAQPLNESAVRAAADHLGLALGDSAVLHARVAAEVRQYLTLEQSGKLDALRAAQHDHRAKLQEKAATR